MKRRYIVMGLLAIVLLVAGKFATAKPVLEIGNWEPAKEFPMAYPALIFDEGGAGEAVGLSYRPGTPGSGYDDPVKNYHDPQLPNPTYIRIANSPGPHITITFRSAPTFRRYPFGIRRRVGLAREFVLYWDESFYGEHVIVPVSR